MSKSLPQRPSLDQLKRQAKDLLKQLRRNEASALVRVKNALPDFETVNDAALSEVSFALSQAQRVVAREYGFASWPKLKQHIEALVEAPQSHSHVHLLSCFYDKIVDSLPEGFSVGDLMDAMSKALLKAHHQRDTWASIVLSNWSPSLVGQSQDEIFAAELTEENGRDSVARYFGFRSWDEIGEAGMKPLDIEFETAVDAVILGNPLALKAMLQANPELVRERSKWGHRSTLLHYIAANGVEIHRQIVPPNAVEIARLLLETGAEPDALSETYGGGVNQTTLSLLITSGHPHEAGLVEPLIEVLAEFGSNLNGLDESGAPLKMALDFGYTKTAQSLVKLGASILSVECAAGVGNLVELNRFLNKAPDQKRLNESLYFSARNGHLDCIQPLIDSGADVDSRGWFGGPALHWAAVNGFEAIVKRLVDAGSDPNIRDSRFKAHAAGWANEGGHASIRDWFLDHGCEVSIVEAAAFGRIDKVEEFLKHDPDSVNTNEGRTPLHEAAGRGHLDILELLLTHGADQAIVDSNGLTPLDWARRGQQKKVIAMLDPGDIETGSI
jgi:ankyrin repeat protein